MHILLSIIRGGAFSTSTGLAAARTARIPLGRSPARHAISWTRPLRPLDFSGIEDVSPIVDAAVSGEMLSIGELCFVSKTLRSTRSLIEQLKEVSSEGHS
ncbi:DNA mismatch repair protein muts2 [Striga asiatica]|uniref:DNA mismatch repair protein muts2 n=1 Tax=Striga asiatica TaxID=4170 RepID=A0A5A7QCP3_STRAF|nr:DNA mismatch repair protein muts2 [Striga asiatica]